MRYTRRRWDVTVLLMGLGLGLSLAAIELLIGGIWPKVAVLSVIFIPFVLFRFTIPKEGFESPEIGKLPREQRNLYIWYIIMAIAFFCAIPVFVRSRQHFWWWAAAGMALLVFTLILTLGVDRARHLLLKGAGDDHKATPHNPSE